MGTAKLCEVKIRGLSLTKSELESEHFHQNVEKAEERTFSNYSISTSEIISTTVSLSYT